MRRRQFPLPVLEPAPVVSVSQWFNAPPTFSLADLRGRVVVLHTFQMLCPGCVAHGIPQAANIEAAFSGAPLSVVGLHTVFEHHGVMTPAALEVFLYEYRISHPVGVDEPASQGHIPRTMLNLRLRGTPSLLLIDAEGRLRASHFGRPSDLLIGAQVGALLSEAEALSQPGCDEEGCALPGA